MPEPRNKYEQAGAILQPHERVERVGKLFRRLLVLAVVALLGWAAVFAAATRSTAREGDDIEAVIGDDCSYDRRSDPGRTHVAEPRYEVDPPSGGSHAARPASGGFKDEATTPSDGELVHAMEHGAVVVWLRSADEATTRDLRRLAEDDRAVIVVPRATLTAPFAVTAWHRRMLCDVVDVVAAERFVRQFRGRGPERVGI